MGSRPSSTRTHHKEVRTTLQSCDKISLDLQKIQFALRHIYSEGQASRQNIQTQIRTIQEQLEQLVRNGGSDSDTDPISISDPLSWDTNVSVLRTSVLLSAGLNPGENDRDEKRDR